MTIQAILLDTLVSPAKTSGVTLDPTITAAAIATIISSIVASSVSFFISKRTLRINETTKLNDELIRINTLSIQYPYLEDEYFIKGWDTWKDNRKNKPKTVDEHTTEKYLRYEGYCISFFNFLERLCKHYNQNKNEIENFVQIKEIVRTHSAWWKNPTGEYTNVEGYSKEFRDLTNEYLK